MDSDSMLDRTVPEEHHWVFHRERDIRRIRVSDAGVVDMSGVEGRYERIDMVADRFKPVISSCTYEGTPLFVYNCDVEVPDGFPDLKSREKPPARVAGLYADGVCYVDIGAFGGVDVSRRAGNSVRHELRHDLLANIHGLGRHEIESMASPDGPHSIARGDLDEFTDGFVQRAYMDELHSFFFEVLEDPLITGPNRLSSVNSDFYSTSRSGPHNAVASGLERGRKASDGLLHYLQGGLLLNDFSRGLPASRSEEADDMSVIVDSMGVSVACHGFLEDALRNVELLWGIAQDLPSWEGFGKFVRDRSERPEVFGPEYKRVTVNEGMMNRLGI